MSPPNRREFLLSSSAALAAGTLLADWPQTARAETLPAFDVGAPIPPHKPLPLEGVHCYTDRLSVPAGETVRFHICATHPHDFQICRLGLDTDDPAGDQVLFHRRVEVPVMQPIHPGSYIHVDKNLPDRPLAAFTVELWVRLWDIAGECALWSQFDRTRSAGIALFVRRDGSLAFYVGDGQTFQAGRLDASDPGAIVRTETVPPSVAGVNKVANGGRGVKLAPWHHVVALYDGQNKELWVDGVRVGSWRVNGVVQPGSAPFRIGAAGADGSAQDFIDADIALPAVFTRALAAEEIRERFAAKAGQLPPSQDLWACWPLTEERGDRVADMSGGDHHGRIVNLGTWMIGGPAFNANVDRFGDYDPAKDPNRGHGLRLASDDLYDCRWQPTIEYTIPVDAKSGIYCARFRFERQGESRLYHTLFIVRPATGARKAPIAFLAATNSWKAYSGTPFAESWAGVKQTIGHAYINTPGDPPMYSFYWQHRAGQGGYQMGLRIPWPISGPYTFHQDLDWECSHLCHADRLTLTWLERTGYAVDVYSDLDLHADPGLLDGYKSVIFVGHSEYWSAESMEALRNYFARGGTCVCLSGNTMFWRVSFDPSHSVIECRKVDAPGAQMAPELRGEIWHSHDGKKGGMSRECGYPAWKYLGLEYMAIHAVGVEGVGPYLVRAADHPLFHVPHELGLKNGDKLGESAEGMPELIGHEGDVRVSTLAKVCLKPLPAGAVQPEVDPPGITLLAEGFADWSVIREGAPWDYFQRPVVGGPERTATAVAAEMILWERPDGGRIFHAGSVSSGRGFANDPKFGLLVQNALASFGVEPVV